MAPALQTALQGVGCYSGGIDGDWGRGSQNALARFNMLAGTQYPVTSPSPETLAAVQAWKGGNCAAAAARPNVQPEKKTAARQTTKRTTASRKKSTGSTAAKKKTPGVGSVGVIIGGGGVGIGIGF